MHQCRNSLLLIKWAVLALVAGLWSPGLVSAQETTAYRQGYSVLGGGFSVVDYEESSTLKVGDGTIDIETEAASIVTQSSGAFVSVNPTWGFYLHTLSTLGVPISGESWELDSTVIRSNSVSFQYQRVELVGSRRLKSSITHALFGAQYGKLEYRRFGAALTEAAADFGIDEDTFESGTVSETVWDVTALVGIERNTVFIGSGRGWRYQGRVLVGVPLLSTIVNTSVANGKSFSNSLNGVEARALGLIGYQYSAHVFVGASLEVSLSRKSSFGREVDSTTGVTEFPSTTFVSIFPGIGAYWSF
jgi:hypothetical protein